MLNSALELLAENKLLKVVLKRKKIIYFAPTSWAKFLSRKQKGVTPKSNSFIKDGSPWGNSQTFPIILPNTIHGWKKDL